MSTIFANYMITLIGDEIENISLDLASWYSNTYLYEPDQRCNTLT
jgi:hypothetical protein